MNLNFSDKNNSNVYLALLCLLYFFITSNYLPFSSNPENSIDEDYIYIEISKDGASTIQSFSDPRNLQELRNEYSLQYTPASGDKIMIQENNTTITKMSGRKRISLGILIGINSATSEDLQAIPGIGPELAQRIIRSRESKSKFKSIYELDSIEGIGEKKLKSIKKFSSLD